MLNFADKKLNVTQKYKIWLIIFAVIFAVGAVLWGVVGMNKSMEYTGGVEVRVNCMTSLAKEEVNSVTEKVFADQKVTVAETREVNDGETLIYRFRLSEVPETLKTSLTNALEANTDVAKQLKSENAVEVERFEASANSTPALWALLALGVALVAIFIYAIFRFKLRTALSVVITIAASVFLTLCITVIARIPVGTSYIAAVAAAFAFSSMFAMFYGSAVKGNVRNAAYKDASGEVIANDSVAQSLKKNILVCVGVAVVLVAGIIFASSALRWTLVAALVAVVASFFTTVTLQSTCYAYLVKGGSKKKNDYVPKMKQVKTDSEQN